MPRVRRTATVPYKAAQMFALVNDVEAYPQFLRWCSGAEITRRYDDGVEARIDVRVGGIHKSFATCNTLQAPRRIDIELVSGPFRRLTGTWTFEDRDEGGSDVTVTLDFEVKHSPFSFIFASIFEEIALSQMSAFLKRADQLYG